jgi:glycosyltransferase involved in cell wall biosynthesis
MTLGGPGSSCPAFIDGGLMRIVFHDDSGLDYTPQTPLDQPLGGAETTVAYLSAALAARGHDVALINKSSELGRVRGVDVLGPQAARQSIINRYDVLVSLTRPLGAEFRRNGVRIPMISWQHQAATTVRAQPFANPEEQQAWSGVVFVSEHQRRNFAERQGLDGHVIRNAASPAVLGAPISSSCFLDRNEDPVLIYASGPGHGLDLLLISFPLIREQLPGVRLRICSDEGIYQKRGRDDPYSAYYALARALPGVEFLGAVSQSELGSCYTEADILAYPTNFIETSCIVAIEAAACGCRFVGTDLGALPETLMGFGDFLPYQNSRPDLTRDFAALMTQMVSRARADPAAYKTQRAEQVARFRSTHTWDGRAVEWESWLQACLRSGFPKRTADAGET